MKLLVKNAHQVVKVCCNREQMLVGEAMKRVEIVQSDGGKGISIAVDRFVLANMILLCGMYVEIFLIEPFPRCINLELLFCA